MKTCDFRSRPSFSRNGCFLFNQNFWKFSVWGKMGHKFCGKVSRKVQESVNFQTEYRTNRAILIY